MTHGEDRGGWVADIQELRAAQDDNGRLREALHRRLRRRGRGRPFGRAVRSGERSGMPGVPGGLGQVRARGLRRNPATRDRRRGRPRRRLLGREIPGDRQHDRPGSQGGKAAHRGPVLNITALIEVFGDYWHGQERTGVPNEQHEKERIDLLRSYGYETLVIWENEMRDSEKLIPRIKEFLCEP